MRPPSDQEIISRVKTRMRAIKKNVNERDEEFRRRKQQHLEHIIWQELQKIYEGVSANLHLVFERIREYFSNHPYT